MKSIKFIPRKLNWLEYIDSFSNNIDIKTRSNIDKNIEIFKKSIDKWLSDDIWFCQIDWMWRWCFKKLDWNNGYLLWKWTWPWIWSEIMRRFLDKLQSSWAEEKWKLGWCLRIDLGEQWPFLVQYKLDWDWNIEITDPRPEWFSIFWATYRESLAWDVYNSLWIEIIKPITLYRNISETSWQWNQELFQEKLSEKVIEEMKLWNANIKSCIVIKDDYHNLDSGILFRHAKTPYRISNLLDLCINNDWDNLKIVVWELIKDIFNENLDTSSIKKLQVKVTKTLAKNSAIMFKEGIIHWQFNIHFQNVSVLWELSDFDSTIFLPLIENSNSNNNDIYKRFKSFIEEWEKKYWVEMLKYLNFDIKLFSWLNNKWVIDEDILYPNILWQIYDLYNQSMRVNDIFNRTLNDNINSWYTILSDEEYYHLRKIFIKTFKDNIWKKDLSFLKDKIWKYIHSYTDKYLKRHLWDVSIYAWKSRNKLNYLEDSFTQEDLEYTLRDSEELFNDIYLID